MMLRPHCRADRRLADSIADDFLDGRHRDGQMTGIAGERQKSVLGVKRNGLIVDCLHFDRSKGNLARTRRQRSKASSSRNCPSPLPRSAWVTARRASRRLGTGCLGNPLSNSAGAWANAR